MRQDQDLARRHRPAVRLDRDGAAVWLCHRCGWKGATGAPPGAGRHDRPRPAPRPTPHGGAVLPADGGGGLSAAAVGLWRACHLLAAGCPIVRYLANRGCAPPRNDVRWHPALPHPSGHVGPCMVALVTDAVTGLPVSLHRTWVAEDGGGKAPLDRPRLLLAGHRKAGGVVRLWPDEEVSLGLLVAEEIETALKGPVTAKLCKMAIWAGVAAGPSEAGGVLTRWNGYRWKARCQGLIS